MGPAILHDILPLNFGHIPYANHSYATLFSNGAKLHAVIQVVLHRTLLGSQFTELVAIVREGTILTVLAETTWGEACRTGLANYTTTVTVEVNGNLLWPYPCCIWCYWQFCFWFAYRRPYRRAGSGGRSHRPGPGAAPPRPITWNKPSASFPCLQFE